MIGRRKQHTAKKVAIGSGIAAVVGYAAGVLTAPKSGKQTRKDVKAAAVKGKAQAEKDLKVAHTEIDKLLKQAKEGGTKVGVRSKKELDELVTKAKDTKEKAREMISAVREGDASNKELDKALKEANDSIEHLKKYLKKK